MSRTYAVELDREHYSTTFQHEFLTALRSRVLSPEIEELWSVGTINHGEDNTGYLLAVVSHHKGSLDELDVVEAERTETLICGCPGWFFQCYDEQVGAKIDDCKHCEEVKRQRRTEIEENQETLL